MDKMWTSVDRQNQLMKHARHRRASKYPKRKQLERTQKDRVSVNSDDFKIKFI